MRRFSIRRMARTGFRRETKRNDSIGWSFWGSKKKEKQKKEKIENQNIYQNSQNKAYPNLFVAIFELIIAVINLLFVLLLWAGKFFLLLYGLFLSKFTHRSNRFIEPYIENSSDNEGKE